MRNRLLESGALKVSAFTASLAFAVTAAERAAHILYARGLFGFWRQPPYQEMAKAPAYELQAAGFFVCWLLCFIYLMYASGHRRSAQAGPESLPESPSESLIERRPVVSPGWGTAIPLDLLAAAAAAVSVLLLVVTFNVCVDYPYGPYYRSYGSDADWSAFYWLYALGAAVLAVMQGFMMSFALRIKLGGWWRNTVVFRAAVLLLRAIRWMFVRTPRALKDMAMLIFRAASAVFGFACGAFSAVFSAIGRGVSGIPLIWKGLLAVGGIWFIEAFVIAFAGASGAGIAMFWFLEHLALLPAAVYLLTVMQRLRLGARALADGDLGAKIDTSGMILDFRSHGEDLNALADGAGKALEQRLKSERFKTELITNVSHDIKTPLTSIINYTDLISKEETGNEKIGEYCEVLNRQSERLRKLLEDLLEASKASTGNLEVRLTPIDAAVLLEQMEGEYEEKFGAAGLTPVVAKPTESLFIMADGRRIWRVFDNLINNICKYSQPGTRVYIAAEKAGSCVRISFRNTSRDPLNLTPDEFMERFVRGDSSRSTEGSGLGLSIARSFTELQGGSMSLEIDADLFKVLLDFPAL